MKEIFKELIENFYPLIALSILIGGVILVFNLLNNIEVKYSKPYVPLTLEERLKQLPPTAKRLSDEAQLIFPEELTQPESFNFDWTHNRRVLKIKVPKTQLTDESLKTFYINLYLKNNWIILENEYTYLFEHQLTGDHSCIDKDTSDGLSYRLVTFATKGALCY